VLGHGVEGASVDAHVGCKHHDARASAGQLRQQRRIVGAGDPRGDPCGRGCLLNVRYGGSEIRRVRIRFATEGERQIGAAHDERVHAIHGRDRRGIFDSCRGLHLEHAQRPRTRPCFVPVVRSAPRREAP
jgi:hypothetical protein